MCWGGHGGGDCERRARTDCDLTIHSLRCLIASMHEVTAPSSAGRAWRAERRRTMETRAMNVPVRPTPAEQWQTAQWSDPW